MNSISRRRTLVAIALCISALTANAGNPAATAMLEAQENLMDAMREHCADLMYKRLNAARASAWREMINQAKSFADSCKPVEDRYALSKAYEDMALASWMLNDSRQAMRWAQACLDGNGQAVGCYARKAEILWSTGKYQEARSVVSRGIMAGEQAVGRTKVEIENVRMRKPDPRAEPVYRRQYLRMWEQLDTRLSNLEESLQTVKSMQDGMDDASMR